MTLASPAPPTEMMIETKNLSKTYRGAKTAALDKLNLSVKEGEVFGFIGPNGAGKTTAIRLLLDLIRPTEGSGKIMDLDITKKSVEIRKKLGYLPGEIFLPESMTGKECIGHYAQFKNNIDKKYLDTLIKKLDIDLKKRISDYSKGNKQKLAIILALMHKPKLLLLDEPTSGLDPLNQQEFYSIIRETQKWGTTTFFSTHILEEAQRICDRVGIIKNGKLIKIEDIDEFRQKNIREIHLETSASIPLSHFEIPGIEKVERTTAGYRIVTIGMNAKILERIMHENIIDVKISEPSLEDLFMRYYK